MSPPMIAMQPIKLIVFSLAFVAFSGPASAAGEQGERTHVLVVALNKSLDKGVKPLRFADDDGARYHELFSRLGAKVTLLSVLDPNTARIHPKAAAAAQVPWLRNLGAAVEQITAQVKADERAGHRTRFIFVYVGHGNVTSGGEGYVNLLDAKLFRRDLYQQVIRKVPAHTVHVLVDACKSYYLIARGGPGDWRDDRSGRSYRDEVKAFLARDTLDRHPNVGAIVSTSGDEEVHEWSAFRSGVFSHQLRSALSGAADVNGDGKVEYSEVGAFIAAANYRVSHPRARIRPFIFPPAARRHAPLVSLEQAGGKKVDVRLGPALSGRFSVEDERGVRHVDLHKASGDTVRLALWPEHRYFIRHGNRESLLPKGASGQLDLASLTSVPARSTPRGSVDDAYRGDLYALPFSRSFYEGYVATTDLPAVSFVQARANGGGPTGAANWHLSAGYALSSPALSEYGGLQHNVALDLRRDIGRLFAVSLRGEFGVTKGNYSETIDFSMYRVAVVGGLGLRWQARRWLELGLRLELGYQALVLEEVDLGGGPGRRSSSPAGMKMGSTARIRLTNPWWSSPRLGLVLHGGLYGYVTRVQDDTDVPLVPEGGLAISYSL